MEWCLPAGLQWVVSEGEQREPISKPHPINCKSHDHSFTISWQMFSDSLLVLFGGVCACNGIHKLNNPVIWHVLQICHNNDKPTHSCTYLAQSFLRLWFQDKKLILEVHHCYFIEREYYISTNCDDFYWDTELCQVQAVPVTHWLTDYWLSTFFT